MWVYTCILLYSHIYTYVHRHGVVLAVAQLAYIYIPMNVYMHIPMYLYVYIHIYIHTSIYTGIYMYTNMLRPIYTCIRRHGAVFAAAQLPFVLRLFWRQRGSMCALRFGPGLLLSAGVCTYVYVCLHVCYEFWLRFF